MFSSNLLSIFAESPIKPLQKHIEIISQCVNELLPFFKAILQQNWQQATAIHENIIKLELAADNLKKDIRLHLPDSLLLPIARLDLLDLLTIQDKMASKAKHLSGVLCFRKMLIPQILQKNFMLCLEYNLNAVQLTVKAINELDELVEAGFTGKEAKLVEKIIMQLDQVEHDTDHLQLELRMQLFTIEKNLDPIDAVFLYKIIDWTGEIADKAQNIGQKLVSFLAK